MNDGRIIVVNLNSTNCKPQSKHISNMQFSNLSSNLINRNHRKIIYKNQKNQLKQKNKILNMPITLLKVMDNIKYIFLNILNHMFMLLFLGYMKLKQYIKIFLIIIKIN